jgi:L-2-hydroxycarboxylate dehydrogenase (NAD+)
MKKKIIKVLTNNLEKKIINFSHRYTSINNAKIISKIIVRAEKMEILTHGLHYFLHSVVPHLKNGMTDHVVVKKDNFIYSKGKNGGGLGLVNIYNCLKMASKIAKKKGICVYSAKDPGKVGAFRTYCPEIIENDQLILMIKNTAPTQGLKKAKKALIGTNPLAIGIPGTNFIYDSSTSTVATNAIRLKNKYNEKFDQIVGLDRKIKKTNDPKKLLLNGAFLNTFASGPFWFKSFYLGVAIECIGALCGGKTSYRVGEHKGTRLFSKEGMLIILIDKKVFPHYKSYLKEINVFLKELKKLDLRIPGSFNKKRKYLSLFKEDYDKLNSIN